MDEQYPVAAPMRDWDNHDTPSTISKAGVIVGVTLGTGVGLVLCILIVSLYLQMHLKSTSQISVDQAFESRAVGVSARYTGTLARNMDVQDGTANGHANLWNKSLEGFHNAISLLSGFVQSERSIPSGHQRIYWTNVSANTSLILKSSCKLNRTLITELWEKTL